MKENLTLLLMMSYSSSNKKHKRQNSNTSGCNWKQELSSYSEKESTHDEMHLGRSAFRDAEASHCSSQGRRDYIGGSARLGVLVRFGTDTSWSIVSCCLSKEWRVTIPASRFVLFNDLRSISQVPSAAFVMHDRWTTDGIKYKRSNLCAMQSTINNTI